MNHYKFPSINHIDEVLEAIREKPEFIVAVRPYGTIINYVMNSPTTFNDPDPRRQALLRECRGIIFDLNGKVIARRLHKFFNVGEKTETLPENLRFDTSHVLYDKLDGSMITPIPFADGRIGWGTKMGLTDVATPVATHAEAQEYYINFAKKCRDLDLTPIFEWTSRKQRIVIDYVDDHLPLLAIRENVSGRYWTPNEVWGFASVFRIPLCRYQNIHINSAVDLLNSIKDVEGIEGYVIRFIDGHMLKVKTPWYIRLHQAKENLLFEKNVVSMIMNEQLDDVKQSLLPEDLVILETFELAVVQGLIETEKKIWGYLQDVYSRYPTRKEFALGPQDSNVSPSIVFRMWDKPREELLPYLKRIITSNCGSQSKIDSIRWMWGKAVWNYGSPAE